MYLYLHTYLPLRGPSNVPVVTVNTPQHRGPCISLWCLIHAVGPGHVP